jgi:hypothetical protein
LAVTRTVAVLDAASATPTLTVAAANSAADVERKLSRFISPQDSFRRFQPATVQYGSCPRVGFAKPAKQAGDNLASSWAV